MTKSDLIKEESNKREEEGGQLKKFKELIESMEKQGIKEEEKFNILKSFSPAAIKINLFILIKSQDFQMVKKLLEAGINPNIKNNDGQTALQLAIKAGDENIVRELLKHGVNVNDQDLFKQTALHYAVQQGKVEAISALIDNNTDVDIQDITGQTALHYATLEGNVEAIGVLAGKAKVNLANNDGQTALHYTAQHGKREVILVLLKAGGDPNLRDSDGKTALQLAVEQGNNEAVKNLIPVTKFSWNLGVKLCLLILIDRIYSIFETLSHDSSPKKIMGSAQGKSNILNPEVPLGIEKGKSKLEYRVLD